MKRALVLIFIMTFWNSLAFKIGGLEFPESSVVLPVSALGLANRLRVIASALHLAKLANRRLIVLWQPSSECSTSFSSLFSITPELNKDIVIADLMDNVSDRYIFESLKKATQQSQQTLKEVYFTSFFVETKLGAEEYRNLDVLLLWTLGMHSYEDESCFHYLFAKSLFYRSLTPSDEVKQIMTSVNVNDGYDIHGNDSSDNHNTVNNKVIGIHLRGYDVTYDWEVVVPDYDSNSINSSNDGGGGKSESNSTVFNSRSRRFDEASPLSSFVHYIDATLAVHPDAVFYVASNVLAVKQFLIERYNSLQPSDLASTATTTNVATPSAPATPATILTILSDVTGHRSSTSGLQLAAAELMLLSQCGYILHTQGSSFGREAAAFHLVPVIDIVSKSTHSDVLYVYSQSLQLPHCGVNEYIRSRKAIEIRKNRNSSRNNDKNGGGSSSSSSSDDIICYQESLERVMCTTTIQLCPCPWNHYQAIGVAMGKSILLYCNDDFNDSKESRNCVSILAESNGYSV